MLPEEVRSGPVVATKLSPPALGRAVLPRPGLLQRLSDPRKTAFLVAPAGYGKSVLAEHWFSGRPEGSAAWVSVDLIDGQPSVFWKHVVAALQATSAGVDDEPLHLLEERGAEDPTFLVALCHQILAAPAPVALVLDDLDRVSDPSVLQGIEFLVERSDGCLHLVATGRTEPRLPLARWRAAHRAELVGQSDLRFDDAEAVAFATTVAPGLLDDAEVHALNRRVEGWPIALQLALVATGASDAPHRAAQHVAGTDPLIADYILAEVIDSLSPEEREVALALSVLTWFDLDLCTSVAGARATRVVHGMRERHLFLSTLDGPDTLRFHDLFRQILEHELRWRDPARHDALHRRAAAALLARGERLRAYRHFVAVGDFGGAVEAVAPSMDLVDEGEVVELARQLHALPGDMVVATAHQAIDLSLAWFLCGGARESVTWMERAEELGPVDDPATALRIAVMRTMNAMASGDDAAAEHHLERCDRLRVEAQGSWSFTARFVSVAARFAVVSERPDVEARLAELVAMGGPPPVTQVFVPAIESLWSVMGGDLHRATARAEGALGTARDLELVEHPALMEALVSVGHCALGLGQLDRAHAVVGRARDSTVWRFPWFQVRAGTLASEILRLRDGGPVALAVVDELRAAHPAVPAGGGIGRMLGRARVAALVACAQVDAALTLLDGMADGPPECLLRGRALVRAGRYRDAEEVLAPAGGWPDQLAIEAAVLGALCTTGSEAEARLVAALGDGARTGWVSPFLGHGEDLDRILDRVPVDELHPALAEVLHPPERSDLGPASDLVPLTAREQSLLELLPTHYTNAQIGEQAYLSVNTVKTNLKALYRKLHVSSRSEAVAVATAAGLLPGGGGPRAGGAARR